MQLWSPVRNYARQTDREPVGHGSDPAAACSPPRGLVRPATRTETKGLLYNLEEFLPTFEMYAEVIVSNQDLEDSAFDLQQDIVDNAAEQFAKLEGTAFVKGTSIRHPEGFMTNVDVPVDVMGTGGGSALTAAGIINHVFSLKSAYANRASLFMNRKTLGAVRQLVDLQSRPIWEPNFSLGSPPTILGIPDRARFPTWTTQRRTSTPSPSPIGGVPITSLTASTCRSNCCERNRPSRGRWPS